MMLKDDKIHPEYYQFRNEGLSSGLKHAVFTRNGGVSRGTFYSLNVGLSTGDCQEKVLSNRKAILDCMGFFRSFYINQVHGNSLCIVREDDLSRLKTFSTAPPDFDAIVPVSGDTADGIVTDVPGVLLVIQVADCQGVILYDPVRKVLANIHSGWRGSVLNIVGAGVDAMVQQFASVPGDILAGVSPSLGPCCAEFINYRDEIPEKLWQYRLNDHYFDFWRITRHQLTDKGVHPKNIEVAGICTKCTSQRFFSHRKDRNTGRFAVVAGLS